MICCGVELFNKMFCIAVPGECKLLCLESLFVGSKSMVALSLAELPGNDSHIVLAMGGLDNKVHVYCGERTGKVCNLNIILFIILFSSYFPVSSLSCSKVTVLFALLVSVCACLRLKRSYRLDSEFGLLFTHLQ